METQTRQPTCDERIADEAQSRLDDMRRFNHKYRRAYEVEEYNAADRLLERQREMILEVSGIESIKVLLSTGGPADWFEVFFYSGNEACPTCHKARRGDIQYIEYHFSDWFDHAERNLTGPEFDTVEEWLRSVVYLGE